jgi:hypothetical protein
MKSETAVVVAIVAWLTLFAMLVYLAFERR